MKDSEKIITLRKRNTATTTTKTTNKQANKKLLLPYIIVKRLSIKFY
jgi:hypothetical protein